MMSILERRRIEAEFAKTLLATMERHLPPERARAILGEAIVTMARDTGAAMAREQGGANDLASLCWRILVVTNHDRRRFVEKIDFVTTPGYLTGPGAREAAGLLPGTGPYRVITDLAVLGYHDQTRRMQVLSLHPGVTLEQVRANTGFGIDAIDSVQATPAPAAEELRILRDEVDPLRYVIGRGGH
jgi:glutaconate CoA-transferase subunit B